MTKLIEKNIPTNNKFTLKDTLLDANTLGIWTNEEKLPNDIVSIENAIIMKYSSRWNLCIDPQN